jgi:ABC-type oligopeptide transport system substrate-binding subunit
VQVQVREVRAAGRRGPGDDVAAFSHGAKATTSRRASTLALFALLACRSPSAPEANAADAARAPAGPLRLALETEFHSLDPAEAGDAVARRLTSQIFDTLVDWDPSADPPRLVPEILAELPEVSADGLVVTLRLRRGADAPRFARDTCLEGQARPVRAGDVAATFARLDPARHPAYALLAGRFADGGVAADDAAATVTLRLTRPQPELPEVLAHPALAVVPPECVAYYDGRDADHPPFRRHPVGSGPFALDHAASELPRTAVLVRNPDLSPRTGRGPCPAVPAAGRVVLHHFSDPGTRLRSFQAGELAAVTVGQAQFDEVVRDGAPVPGAVPAGATLRRFPTLATDLLVFRMQDPEVGAHADPRVGAEHRALRRAVALAFDAARYLRVVRNGGAWAEPRARIVPRGLGGAFDDAALHAYAPPAADMERARRALADAGDPPRTLRYWTEPGEAELQEAEILRDALRPLGLDLAITQRTGYLGEVLAGRSDAHLFALRFEADWLDPANFLAPFVCGDPGNYSGHCDPAYDAAFAEFAAAPPGPGRDAAAAALERRLGEAVAVRPIDQPSAWYLAQPWLRGLVRHPLAGLRVELLCAE